MTANTGPTPIEHMTPLLESEVLSALDRADSSCATVTNFSGKTFEEQYSGYMVFDVETSIGTIRLSTRTRSR